MRGRGLPIPVHIGRINGAPIYLDGKIQAFALYDCTLTAPQVAAVAAAMAAL